MRRHVWVGVYATKTLNTFFFANPASAEAPLIKEYYAPQLYYSNLDKMSKEISYRINRWQHFTSDVAAV